MMWESRTQTRMMVAPVVAGRGGPVHGTRQWAPGPAVTRHFRFIGRGRTRRDAIFL